MTPRVHYQILKLRDADRKTLALSPRWHAIIAARNKHLSSTEGMRECHLFDEPCCQLCCGGFQGGLSWVVSARQSHSHVANSHGGIRQLSVQQLQCLSCRFPIVHKAHGVSCAQCAEAVHRRCLKTHWETCRHSIAANRESIWPIGSS